MNLGNTIQFITNTEIFFNCLGKIMMLRFCRRMVLALSSILCFLLNFKFLWSGTFSKPRYPSQCCSIAFRHCSLTCSLIWCANLWQSETGRFSIAFLWFVGDFLLFLINYLPNPLHHPPKNKSLGNAGEVAHGAGNLQVHALEIELLSRPWLGELNSPR